MKTILAAVLVCVVSMVSHAEDFKLVNGKEYKGVTVSRVEPDGIMIATDAGVEKLRFVELEATIQKKYGYDPKKALAFAAAAQNAAIERQKANEPPDPSQMELMLGSPDLAGAYADNEVAADLKFKNRRFIVEGVIRDIGNDLFGHPYVLLNAAENDPMNGVKCVFPSEAAERVALSKKGDHASIRGTVEGKGMIVVLMKDCEFPR